MANPFNIPPTSTSNTSTSTYSSSSSTQYSSTQSSSTLASNPIITRTRSTVPVINPQAGYSAPQAAGYGGYSTPQAAGYAAPQATGYGGYSTPQAAGYGYGGLPVSSTDSMGNDIKKSVITYLKNTENLLKTIASGYFTETNFDALSNNITVLMSNIDNLCTNNLQLAYKHTEALRLIQEQQLLLNIAEQFLLDTHATVSQKPTNPYIQSSIKSVNNLTVNLSRNIHTQIKNEIIRLKTRKKATTSEEMETLENTINNVKKTTIDLAGIISSQRHQTSTTANNRAFLESISEDLELLLAPLYSLIFEDDAEQSDEEQGNKGQENKGKRRADPSVNLRSMDSRSMDSRSFSMNPSDRGPTFNPSSVFSGSIHTKTGAGSAIDSTSIVKDPLQPPVTVEFSSLGVAINHVIRSLSDMTQNIYTNKNTLHYDHNNRTIRHALSVNYIARSIEANEANPELIVQALRDLITLLPNMPNYKIPSSSSKKVRHRAIENCRSFTMALCNGFCSQIKQGREKLAQELTQGYADQGFISRLDRIQTVGLSAITRLSQMHQLKYGNSGIPFFSDENKKNLDQIVKHLMKEVSNDPSLTSTPRDKSILTDTIILIASKNHISDSLAKGTYLANEVINSLLMITTPYNTSFHPSLENQFLTFINLNKQNYVAPQVIAHTFQQMATLAPHLDKYDATMLSGKNGVLVLATYIENMAQAMADSFSKQSTILRDMTDGGLNPSVIQELDTLEQQIADAMKKLLLLNSPKNMRNTQLLSNNDIRNQLQKFITDAEDKQMSEISNYVTAHGGSIFSDPDLNLDLDPDL